MSIIAITDQGELDIPGAYASFDTQQTSSGLSTTGVLMLVGEADGGPDYTLEPDIDANSYGPDQLADVVAKYKSGNLVDAYRGACSPSKDPEIPGAPSAIKIIKTNPSLQATMTLTKVAGGTYGTLSDNNYGKLGNMFTGAIVAAPAEVVPTTGALTYIPPATAATITIRVDGGTGAAVVVSTAETPATLQAALAAVTGLTCTGGVARASAPGAGGKISIAAAANVITISSFLADGVTANPWATTPIVGDTLQIVSGALQGAGNANIGSYVVTAATSSTATATKLADASGGTLTAPVNVAAVVATTSAGDFYSPLTISRTTAMIDGVGKAIEFTRTALVANDTVFYVLGTTTAAPVFSVPATPVLFTSASEYGVTENIVRAFDSTQEAKSAGGEVALQLAYLGTTATCTIGGVTGTVSTPSVPGIQTKATTLITTVTGGSGTSLASIDLTAFPTLNDLVNYINTFAFAGYAAKVGNATLGLLPPTALDQGTFGICCTTTQTPATTLPANYSGRIKVDGYRFYNAALTSLNTNLQVRAPAGLPAVAAAKPFTGGTRGATTQAVFQAAIDALAAVDGNFVVPLFSQNATADILTALTDSASTYLIDSVNSYVLSHCNAQSKLTARKNRQGFCSKRDTFANAQTAAQTLAAGRVSLAFQDVMDIGKNGVQQFQPWMNATKAAAAQAAAGPKAIFNKSINVSGAVQNVFDFSPKNNAQVITAQKAGLLTLKKLNGFRYISDQTTYGTDQSVVWNSIQAIYAADTVAQTSAQRMEAAFVGKTFAQISAGGAVIVLSKIFGDMKSLGYIASSDGAPSGFKDIKIKIVGPVMKCVATIFLATACYFVTIGFQINQVTQSA